MRSVHSMLVGRTRTLCVAIVAIGTLAGGAAVAVVDTGASRRLAPDLGQTGASPVPVIAPISATTKFNLATFNVLGYDHTESTGSKRNSGYGNGATRIRTAVELFKQNKIDVVGLQEFQPKQYERWVKRASSTYDIWPGNTETVGFLRNSITWRRDKFQMVSNTWVKLPYFKGDVLRMPVVLLRSLKTGQQFYVMNFQNPADVRGNAAMWRSIGQRIQIALVNQLHASNQLPVLWVGDMNARSQVYCRVTAEAGMTAANGGYRDATSCTPPKKMVVDWLFGTGVTFKKYQQLRNAKVAKATDHHLVSSRVLIAPTNGSVPPPPVPVTTCTTTTPTPTATTTPTAIPTVYPTTTGPVTSPPTPTPASTLPPTATPTPTPTPAVACITVTPSPVIFPTAP